MSNPKPPSTCWLFILCVCYGWTGAHHLSLGRECQALLWYTSFGLFGLGVLVDVFLLPTYRKFLVDSIGGEEQDETEQTHSSLSLQEVLLADHLNPNVGSPKRSTTRSRPSDKTSVCSSLWGCIVRALGGSFFGAYYDVIASFASTALDLVLDPLGGTLGDALRARLCVKAFARSVAVWLCCNAGARTSHLMLVIVIGFALEIFFEAFFGGTFYGDINKGIVTEFEEEETQGLEQSFLCSFVLSVITLAFATRKRTFQELRPRPYWRRWLAWSSAIFVFWTAILAGFVYHFEMVNSKGEVQTVLDMASEFFESTEWLQVKAIFGRYANITKEQGLSAGLQSFVEDLQQEMEGSRDRGSTGGGKRGSKRGRGGDWEGAEGDEESEEDEEGGWAWAWFEENINWALGTFSGLWVGGRVGWRFVLDFAYVFLSFFLSPSFFESLSVRKCPDGPVECVAVASAEDERKSDWKTLGVSPGASDDEIKD
eukprot:Cvel_29749.t1-p1 / transcript=Cvel_29749.t1 / gene=Cvel_29749 / organism=Chromera_velia_CCMP2878 / gene_product=hypothetical protein / transcript_product=hypothetical protein / location=Cvel_scaffold4130:6851-11134(+) / protein_length=482 / sequence_SO=supercontig / SO=protein_coding / is_pseudo=false